MDILKALQEVELQLQDVLVKIQEQINAIKAVGQDNYEVKVEIAAKAK
jgi:hypothetical protein